MMVFLVLSLMASDLDSKIEVQWLVRDTGMYQPLRRDEVLVTSDGSFNILNFDEAQIRRYHEDGKVAVVIGYKVIGPGGLLPSLPMLGYWNLSGNLARASMILVPWPNTTLKPLQFKTLHRNRRQWTFRI